VVAHDRPGGPGQRDGRAVMAALEMTEVQVPGHPFPTVVWRGGSGRPIVFLHGAGGLSPKDPALARLAERFEVIAPVHPGFAHLAELDDLQDVRDLALYHDELLETLGMDQATVIGHSFGAMVAAELAAHVPARVGNLVLVSAIGLWRDDDPVADLLAIAPGELPGLLWADPSSPVVAETAAAMSAGDVDPVEAMINASRGITAATKYLAPIPDRGLSRRLYRIRARTLIVWGAQDRLVPASYAKSFASAIAGSRVEIIANAGHLVAYEQLDRYCGLVAGFLSEV
jgi:pimeloyl-ACP methyl ester carboxylesterase